MDPQTGNMEESAEVINIVVIKDPSGWNSVSTPHFPAFHIQQANSSQQSNSSQFVQGRNVTAHPPLYKSQSFTVGIPPTSLSTQGHPFIDNDLNANAFSCSNDSSAFVSQIPPSSSSFTHATRERPLSVGGNAVHPRVNSMNASLDVSNCFADHTPSTRPYSTDNDNIIKKKLIRHRSVPLSHQGNMTGPDKNIFFSAHSNSNQTCSPSMVSPAHLPIKDGFETFNSPMATTPDSGFCTPSVLSAPFKGLLSSTPALSSECHEMYLNDLADYSPVAGEKSLDSLFHDSIDWMGDASLDSAIDEEGQSSLNSSLRSVNWLKSFSMGESGLNISPPMPSSCQLGQGVPLSQNQQEGSTKIQQSSSDLLVVRQNTTCSLPCKAKVQEDSSKASSNLLIPSISAPIPVLMPTQLHSQMPAHPFLAPSQCVAIAETPGQQSAPGGTKTNKRKTVTRKKNKGHFFPRPSYSYTDLIKLAIKSSETGELTSREIVAWIEDHFPFFKHEARTNWKNTLMQSLSQHADFVKVEKKPGRKWTLCSTASHQHLKPVSKPPEIPSHVLASFTKPKRNAPQPILPKISAYALVPIQNLALEAVPQSNGLSTIQANSNGPPIPQQQQQQMIRILPNPQQNSKSHTDHTNLSSLKSMPEKAKPRPCQLKEPKSTVSKSKTGNRIKKQSVHPSASRCSVLGQNVTHHGTKEKLSHVDKLTSSTQPRPKGVLSNKEVTGLQKNSCELSSFSKPQGFPIDSVVDIHEEEGNHPGEKKIIFVLKDNQKSVNSKPQELPIMKPSEKNVGSQPAVKRKLAKSSLGKVNANCEKRMCLTKKLGPVMNLRHILQQDYQEDRVAAETIGQLLLEEDEKAVRDSAGLEEGSGHGEFTLLKSYRRENQCISNLLPSLESGLQDGAHCPQRDFDSFDRNYPNMGQMKSHSEKIVPAMSKKSNIFRRVNIIKNKTSTSKPQALSEKSFSNTNVKSDSNRAFASASQLVFTNPAVGEESRDSSISSGCHNIPEIHSTSSVPGNSDLPRPTLYRTKSRRKQVHVPLTNEISPIRSYDSFQDKNRHHPRFQTKSSRSDIISPPPRNSMLEEHNSSNNVSSSSCSDVENSSSLHFFSTLSKTCDISNKENMTLSGSCNASSPSLHQTRGCHSVVKGTDDSKSRLAQCDSQGRMSFTTQPSHLSHTSLIPTDSIPAIMCTPPCGTLLRPRSVPNISVPCSNEPLTSSSPALSPGVMQQLNSIFPLTPPSAMTPLSMSTPNRPLSNIISASQGAGDNSEVSPHPGSVNGLLDSSFLDHLDTLMADLHSQQSSPGNGVFTTGFPHS